MCKIPDSQIRILEKESISCTDLKTMMCDYADGDLLASLKQRLDIHAEECPECKSFRNSYLAVVRIAAEIKPIALPEGAENRLRRALNERLGLNLSAV